MSFLPVSIDKFPSLKATLQSRLPKSAMSHNTILMVLKNMMPPSVTTGVFAFNGIIAEDEVGSKVFVTILQYRDIYDDYYIIASFPDVVTDEMWRAFEAIIPWSYSMTFAAFEAKHGKPVQEMCSRIGKLLYADPCNFMTMTVAEAEKAMDGVSFDPTLKVRSLSPEDGALAAARWSFASPSGTPEMFAETIKYAGSAGIYLPCGRLVSWVLLFTGGSINALHTEEDQRGRGFGELTTRKICQHAGKAGLVPNVQVHLTNHVSRKVMLRTGFKDVNIIEWISYRPTN